MVKGTLIVTDDWSGYADLRKRGYDHRAIAECGDPEISEEFLPISHLVFANLKTWRAGTHHGVSARHLQAYLNEFTFRFNRRFYPFTPSARCSALQAVRGRRPTTNFTQWTGRTLHLVGVCLNRIGMTPSSLCIGAFSQRST